MRLLLDTHVFVWALTQRHRLSNRASNAIQDGDSEVWLSAVSAYEIEFKRPKSAELQRLPSDLEEARSVFRFEWLSLDRSHASVAGRLPRIHGDPWDRILVAQAMAEGLTLVSIDPMLTRYGAPVLW